GADAAATQCSTNSGSGAAAASVETCSVAAGTLTAGDTYSFELKVTDSATTAESATSAASSTVSVALALTAPGAPTPSATALDANQALTVSGTIPSSGTAPYTWTWKLSVNGGAYGAATECELDGGSGASAGAPETCDIVAGSFTAGTTLAFELEVSDGATASESSTSPVSGTVNVNTALTPPAAPIPNATSLDADQSLAVTGTIPSNGTATYAWQWLMSVDGGEYSDATPCGASASGTGAAPETLETCSVPSDTLASGDTYTFELEVTDSASSPESATSTASATVAVSSALVGGSPSPTGVVLDEGQSVLLAANPSGGSGGNTLQWYSGSSASACEALSSPISGATGAAFEAQPSSTTYYCYVVEDSDSDLAGSAAAAVTVNSALTAPAAPSTSATALDDNQPLTVNGILPSTGTVPYSWQWLVSVNGGAYADASACEVASGSGAMASALETCVIPANSLTVGDSYSFELQVTDSATTAENALSPTSSGVTVNSALAAPAAPMVSATALDADQTETVTGTIPTSGTARYSWLWLVSIDGATDRATTQCARNAGGGAAGGATETCSIAAGTLTAGDSLTFELQVTDGSGAGRVTETSNPSTTVSVSPPLSAPTTPTVSASALSLAESLTVTSTLPSTGTPGYAWQWLISIDAGDFASASVCGSSASGSGGVAGLAVRCTVPSGSWVPGSTYAFELKVTDSATSAENATSLSSPAVTVAPPAIGVGTSQGPVGAIYSVAGSGFSASSSVTVAFGSVLLAPTACSDGTFSETQISTDANGRFDCTFKVPSEGAGAYPIVGTDKASSSGTVAFSFTVTTPAVSVTPAQGRAGDTVTVNGTGFSVSAPLALLDFDSQAITSCVSGSLTTNSAGAFTCTFAVPSGISGSTVSATDAGGAVASAAFTVVAASSSSSGFGGWLWLIVGVVVVALLLLILGVRRRRTTRGEEAPAGPSPGGAFPASPGAEAVVSEVPHPSPTAPTASAAPVPDRSAEVVATPELAVAAEVVPPSPASNVEEPPLESGPSGVVVDANSTATEIPSPTPEFRPPEAASSPVPPAEESPALVPPTIEGLPAEDAVAPTAEVPPMAPEAIPRSESETPPANEPSGANIESAAPAPEALTSERADGTTEISAEPVPEAPEPMPAAPSDARVAADAYPAAPPAEPPPESLAAVPPEATPVATPQTAEVTEDTTTSASPAEPAVSAPTEVATTETSAVEVPIALDDRDRFESRPSEPGPQLPESEPSFAPEPTGELPPPPAVGPTLPAPPEVATPTVGSGPEPAERSPEPPVAAGPADLAAPPPSPALPPASPVRSLPEPVETEAKPGPTPSEMAIPLGPLTEIPPENPPEPKPMPPQEPRVAAPTAPPVAGPLVAARMLSLFMARPIQESPPSPSPPESPMGDVATPAPPRPTPEARRSEDLGVPPASEDVSTPAPLAASPEASEYPSPPRTESQPLPPPIAEGPAESEVIPEVVPEPLTPELATGRAEPEPAEASGAAPVIAASTPPVPAEVPREETSIQESAPSAPEQSPPLEPNETTGAFASFIWDLDEVREPAPENPPNKPAESRSGDSSADYDQGSST
ncbi:MAG TPA: hypothetical protein VEG66_04785, partial [Thermoplasmata archaeon]|nr:hypothetical protein [Thermoplasmata archaeon]